MIKLKDLILEKEDKRCSGEVVLTGMNFYRTRRCNKIGTIKVGNKWYCKSHNPKKEEKPKKDDKLKKAYFYAKYFKKNKEDLLEKLEINKIYLDLDGVLTDFVKQFSGLSQKNPKEYEKEFGQEKFWNLIDAEGIKFWSEMPWTTDGKDLWNNIKDKVAGILTAPTNSVDSRNGKRVWVKRELGAVPLFLRQAERKKDFAKPYTILIDDDEDNINQWKEAGGIGILHISTADTLKKLKEI